MIRTIASNIDSTVQIYNAFRSLFSNNPRSIKSIDNPIITQGGNITNAKLSNISPLGSNGLKI